MLVALDAKGKFLSPRDKNAVHKIPILVLDSKCPENELISQRLRIKLMEKLFPVVVVSFSSPHSTKNYI